jgi:hypothetical protein
MTQGLRADVTGRIMEEIAALLADERPLAPPAAAR